MSKAFHCFNASVYAQESSNLEPHNLRYLQSGSRRAAAPLHPDYTRTHDDDPNRPDLTNRTSCENERPEPNFPIPVPAEHNLEFLHGSCSCPTRHGQASMSRFRFNQTVMKNNNLPLGRVGNISAPPHICKIPPLSCSFLNTGLSDKRAAFLRCSDFSLRTANLSC